MSVTTMPEAETAKGKKGKKGKDAEGGGGGKKKLIIIVVLPRRARRRRLLVLPQAAGPAPEPVRGEVVTLDATQINLAGGHYLRIGIALQLTADGHGGRRQQGAGRHDRPLQRPVDHRAERTRRSGSTLKEELAKELDELYDGEVMEVYFTEFVTQ